jgi:hypothetical protein
VFSDFSLEFKSSIFDSTQIWPGFISHTLKVPKLITIDGILSLIIQQILFLLKIDLYQFLLLILFVFGFDF